MHRQSQEGIPHLCSQLSPFRPSWRSLNPACPSAQRTVRHFAGRFCWERSTSRYCGRTGHSREELQPIPPNRAWSHGTSSTQPQPLGRTYSSR